MQPLFSEICFQLLKKSPDRLAKGQQVSDQFNWWKTQRSTCNGAHDSSEFLLYKREEKPSKEWFHFKEATNLLLSTDSIHLHRDSTTGLFIIHDTYKGQSDTYGLASPSDFHMPPVLQAGWRTCAPDLMCVCVCLCVYKQPNGEQSPGFCKPVCVAVRQK